MRNNTVQGRCSYEFHHHPMGRVLISVETFTLGKQREADFANRINKVVNSIDCSENQHPNSLALVV